MKTSMIFIIGIIFVSNIFDTISQITLKKAINFLDFHIDSVKKVAHLMISLVRIPLVWASVFFAVVSLLIWVFVLSKADLNLAFSLESMRYILIALVSMRILKEKVGPLRWVGIMCVTYGIFLVAST
jgi:drug/metabolite transporter (DMT)-like permease